MKDQIEKAKNFVKKHRTELVAATAASAATAIFVIHKLVRLGETWSGLEIESLDFAKRDDGVELVLLYLKDGTSRAFGKKELME